MSKKVRGLKRKVEGEEGEEEGEDRSGLLQGWSGG